MMATPITDGQLMKYGWNYLNGKSEGTLTNDIWLDYRFNIDFIDKEMKIKSHFEGECLYRKLAHIDTMEKLKEFWLVFSGEPLQPIAKNH